MFIILIFVGKGMNYILIGCGRVSKNHILGASLNSLNIVAISDLELTKSNKLLDSFGLKNVQSIEQYNLIIKEINIDIAAIAVDSEWHFQIASEILTSRINLIIEKPVALNLGEIDHLLELCKIHRVKVTICHQNRFNLAVKRLSDSILGK